MTRKEKREQASKRRYHQKQEWLEEMEFLIVKKQHTMGAAYLLVHKGACNAMKRNPQEANSIRIAWDEFGAALETARKSLEELV
jgi:hypothetical protein